jgi:hypothetical protein
LLHLDTDFTDSTGRHTFTAAGGAAITTSNAKYGAGSYQGVLNAGRLVSANHADWNLTGDFTIDFWYRPSTSLPADNGDMLLATSNAGATTTGWVLDYYGPLNAFLFASGTGGGFWDRTGGSYIGFAWSRVANVWAHIAIVRASGTIRMFVNGTQIGGNVSNSTSHTTSNELIIGDDTAKAGTYAIGGQLDEIRIVNGYAVWTSNFTPTGPYT